MMTQLWLAATLAAGSAAGAPVVIGLDLEFGHATSTSAAAVKWGALLAVEEINHRGGVLGGRPLVVVERDNRSNPSRGMENLRELAQLPDLVAVLGGKFSQVLLQQIPLAHEFHVNLFSAWAAADDVVDSKPGSYVFRISMRDSWALPALLEHARGRGLKRVGLLLSNVAWGRSSEAAARAWLERQSALTLAGVEWFNWGDTTLLPGYRALQAAGSEAVILVANEPEGAVLVRELATLPRAERIPILSHWGVTGGDFPALCGPALQEVDLVVVQTFTFFGRRSPQVSAVLEAARRKLGVSGPEAIKSPVGLAQAYDIVQILARAVDLAGTTDRARVRDALEHVRYEEGLVRRYGQPFAPGRHDALGPADVFLARWDARGVLVPAR
jgi:branched-chain amino acid transport system substrate-binding protein